MFLALQSMEAIAKSSSEIRILMIFSCIFSIVAFISMVKICWEHSSTNNINDNKLVGWICLFLVSIGLSLGFAYSAKKNAFSYLGDEEVVVNKEFFTKTKYLIFDDRTIFVANACMEAKASCSKANRNAIFGAVDKEVIKALKTEFDSSCSKRKFILRLEEFINKSLR